jgi:hypothetical protein
MTSRNALHRSVPQSALPDFTPVPRKLPRHDGWTPARQKAFIEASSAGDSHLLTVPIPLPEPRISPRREHRPRYRKRTPKPPFTAPDEARKAQAAAEVETVRRAGAAAEAERRRRKKKPS